MRKNTIDFFLNTLHFLFLCIFAGKLSTVKMPVPPLSEDSPFSWDPGILFTESGVKSLIPKNTERFSGRDQLIAALENQIRKQEEIIQTQEKTIELFTKHNNELTAFLDQFFKA